MLRHTKGVRNTKSWHSGDIWLTTKKTYATTVSQNTLRQPKTKTKNIHIHSRATHKILGKCDRTNSPTTGLLPKSKAGHARSEI